VSNGPFSTASVVEKSNRELSVASIPYTYTYGVTPQGCCGGYYDDPKLDIFNRKGNIPTYISKTDGVEWNRVGADYELVADLGDTHSITELKVSYIVNSGWGKYAPKSITMKGKLSKDSDWTYESTVSKGFATGRGGHSVSWPVSNWGNVQYIQLSEVIPSRPNAVMSRLVVYGSKAPTTKSPSASFSSKSPSVSSKAPSFSSKSPSFSSKSPTEEPSNPPTLFPTEEPTAEPTEEPTAEPTEVPTAKPTEVPTAKPTEVPTVTPTDVPTVTPTETPVCKFGKLKLCLTGGCIWTPEKRNKPAKCTPCSEEKKSKSCVKNGCVWKDAKGRKPAECSACADQKTNQCSKKGCVKTEAKGETTCTSCVSLSTSKTKCFQGKCAYDIKKKACTTCGSVTKEKSCDEQKGCAWKPGKKGKKGTCDRKKGKIVLDFE